LTPANITGKDCEKLLEEVGVTCNKNQIPFDPAPPLVTSGIRLGTPALTTRGLKEDQMKEIAAIITEAIAGRDNEKTLEQLKSRTAELCRQFPLYA
jgi:glycine hydroxymethyltransferase